MIKPAIARQPGWACAGPHASARGNRRANSDMLLVNGASLMGVGSGHGRPGVGTARCRPCLPHCSRKDVELGVCRKTLVRAPVSMHPKGARFAQSLWPQGASRTKGTKQKIYAGMERACRSSECRDLPQEGWHLPRTRPP